VFKHYIINWRQLKHKRSLIEAVFKVIKGTFSLPRTPKNLLFPALHNTLNTRRRHTIRDIAANAAITSNPGTSFPAPCAGVVTGDVAGDTVDVCLGDIKGVDVATGVCTGDIVGRVVSAPVNIEVSYFAFHAVIPPSML